MAVGIYGTKKLADVSVDDVDMLYAYSASREVVGDLELKPLYSTVTSADLRKMLGADGVYKMRLPASIFNQLGFYTVVVKPKTFETTILDCSNVVTAANNDIQISKKGIVIPVSQFQGSSNLVGYQIEYFDKNGTKSKNLHRIITSSDLVSISTNNGSVAKGSTTYVLDPNGTSVFLTVTPDESSLLSSNAQIDIGTKGQRILISNTFFDPVVMEVEMVEHTLETLSYALYGNSTRDLETGILTFFNNKNQIYRQYNLYTQKKKFGNGNIDIREQRTIVNFNQDFNNVSQGL